VTTVISVVDWLNLVLFSALGVVALLQWRAGRGRAGLWAALSFGALALVADAGRLLPDDPMTDFERLAQRVLIAVLVLFPYLLYRFTTAFRPPTLRLERLLGLMTVVVLAWTFLLPDFPAEDEPWTSWFWAYITAFLVHWTVLSIVVAVRLWRARSGQPSAVRRRMEMFSFGATSITAALVIAGTGPASDSPAALAVSLLGTLSGATFLLALAPPPLLRLLWRRPEQRRLQHAIGELVTLATNESEIARRVLPPMAAIVGARGVALQAHDGRMIGSHGVTGAMLHELEALPHALPPSAQVVVLPMQFGRLVVWTGPYGPYFGRDELALLETLGALTGLALDRVRLFAKEREARIQLQQADELKTQFVALAAHELRTPVTTIHGFAKTLHMRGEQLGRERRAELERVLAEQTTRMGGLVEQLLDLSRLDAHAVSISPEPLAVRGEVEKIVTAAAGDRGDQVEVDIAPDLVTIADRNAFERIVSNLVVNALHYGEAPITLTAKQQDRHFRLAVEDRGPGIPPELLPSLFERFARGRTHVPGTGLGLAIARAYAQAHGGDLVYRPAEPTGSRFEVVIPKARQAENASA
jgi:signal transduction histidine kinase